MPNITINEYCEIKLISEVGTPHNPNNVKNKSCIGSNAGPNPIPPIKTFCLKLKCLDHLKRLIVNSTPDNMFTYGINIRIIRIL